jgi:hypothetical protein
LAIYAVSQDQMTPINPTSFGKSQLREREDLQRLLRDQIEVIASDVLVISEEFGEWEESRRRIDLLCVDKNGSLVVVELKRTNDGGHMELQAVRYAAMVSTLTVARATEIFGQYLTKRGLSGDPEEMLLEFLEWDELDEERFGQDVRILLVSADFSRELTTAVMWLNEHDLDIRCVRIKPYTHGDEVLIDVQQIVPLPEAADYQVQLREKKRQEQQSRKSTVDFTRYDVTVDGEVFPGQWKRNAILIVVKGLVQRGKTPEEILKVLSPVRKGRIWRSVLSETSDPAQFRQLAEAEGREKQSLR